MAGRSTWNGWLPKMNRALRAVWCVLFVVLNTASVGAQESLRLEPWAETNAAPVGALGADALEDNGLIPPSLIQPGALVSRTAAGTDTYSVLVGGLQNGVVVGLSDMTPSIHFLGTPGDAGGNLTYPDQADHRFRAFSRITEELDGTVVAAIQVSAAGPDSAFEPWVDASSAGTGLTGWFLDMGTDISGGDGIEVDENLLVSFVRFEVFDSKGQFIHLDFIDSDQSVPGHLSASSSFDLGGEDIAGADVATLGFRWVLVPNTFDVQIGGVVDDGAVELISDASPSLQQVGDVDTPAGNNTTYASGTHEFYVTAPREVALPDGSLSYTVTVDAGPSGVSQEPWIAAGATPSSGDIFTGYSLKIGEFRQMVFPESLFVLDATVVLSHSAGNEVVRERATDMSRRGKLAATGQVLVGDAAGFDVATISITWIVGEPLFGDGFESGDASGWSPTSP